MYSVFFFLLPFEIQLFRPITELPWPSHGTVVESSPIMIGPAAVGRRGGEGESGDGGSRAEVAIRTCFNNQNAPALFYWVVNLSTSRAPPTDKSGNPGERTIWTLRKTAQTVHTAMYRQQPLSQIGNNDIWLLCKKKLKGDLKFCVLRDCHSLPPCVRDGVFYGRSITAQHFTSFACKGWRQDGTGGRLLWLRMVRWGTQQHILLETLATEWVSPWRCTTQHRKTRNGQKAGIRKNNQSVWWGDTSIQWNIRATVRIM